MLNKELIKQRIMAKNSSIESSGKKVANDDSESQSTEKEWSNIETSHRKFVIVTSDYSGIGFAKKLKDEGETVVLAYKIADDEENVKEFELVGTGIVDKIEIDEIIDDEDWSDAYWIFDQNHLTEYSMLLRGKGYKVLGACDFATQSENDRNFGTDLVKQYSLQVPETFEFKSVEEGLKFLDDNPDRCFVFKPDGCDKSYLTFVPNSDQAEAGNRELYDYLSSLTEATDSYILQEKILNGLETNFEVWFYQGEPFFAFCCLENKKKLNGDVGENVGCAMDLAFTVPLDCRAVQETVGKLFPYYKEIGYTGFGDMNIIFKDHSNYFLEFCNRFGYNSHITLLLALANDTLGNILADMLDGNIEDFYKKFKYGFGGSVSLYIDHKRQGLPIFVFEDIDKNFYCYESYSENGKLFLAGYDHQVGVLTSHDYTPEEVAEDLIDTLKAKKINFPDMAYRSDLQRENYDNSPIRRYRSLDAMRYIS